MSRKSLYMVLILILAVVIVADVLFILQGQYPLQPGEDAGTGFTPPDDAQEGGERPTVTGANIANLVVDLQETLDGASSTIKDIENDLNK